MLHYLNASQLKHNCSLLYFPEFGCQEGKRRLKPRLIKDEFSRQKIFVY